MRLELGSRQDDGSWLLNAAIKRPGGAAIVGFRAREQADGLMIPERSAVVAGELKLELDMAVTNVMNLFQVRHMAASAGAFDRAPAPAERPCGVREVYRVEDPWPESGYTMEHELAPRVYLAGVVRSQIVGRDDYSRELTSFGGYFSRDAAASDCQDYVDLSYPQRVVHGDVSVAYPATWLALPRRGKGRSVGSWAAPMLGGDSHSGTFCVDTFEGSAVEVARWADERVHRWEAPGSPSAVRLRSVKGAREDCRIVADYAGGPIVGTRCERVRVHLSGQRAAYVTAFLNFFEGHPLAPTLGEREPVLRQIVDSLEFESPRPD